MDLFSEYDDDLNILCMLSQENGLQLKISGKEIASYFLNTNETGIDQARNIQEALHNWLKQITIEIPEDFKLFVVECYEKLKILFPNATFILEGEISEYSYCREVRLIVIDGSSYEERVKIIDSFYDWMFESDKKIREHKYIRLMVWHE